MANESMYGSSSENRQVLILACRVHCKLTPSSILHQVTSHPETLQADAKALPETRSRKFNLT